MVRIYWDIYHIKDVILQGRDIIVSLSVKCGEQLFHKGDRKFSYLVDCS